jgi:hypothetical protein
VDDFGLPVKSTDHPAGSTVMVMPSILVRTGRGQVPSKMSGEMHDIHKALNTDQRFQVIGFPEDDDQDPPVHVLAPIIDTRNAQDGDTDEDIREETGDKLRRVLLNPGDMVVRKPSFSSQMTVYQVHGVELWDEARFENEYAAEAEPAVEDEYVMIEENAVEEEEHVDEDDYALVEEWALKENMNIGEEYKFVGTDNTDFFVMYLVKDKAGASQYIPQHELQEATHGAAEYTLEDLSLEARKGMATTETW